MGSLTLTVRDRYGIETFATFTGEPSGEVWSQFRQRYGTYRLAEGGKVFVPHAAVLFTYTITEEGALS